ncbi:MAG: c-type cytochrome [Rhodothermales bacterium]|nr:c-type cytochrome [Rhodothermales bacterium]
MTVGKIELGRRLFFDPILSSDRSISCASCHEPERAFADPRAVSTGVAGRKGIRNSPTLVNVAYLRELFWDGGALTLENQVLAPLQDHNEMDAELSVVLSRLAEDDAYAKAFEAEFGTEPTVANLTQSIAAYERTIVSGGSRYDDYKSGTATALTATERIGLELFEGKAGCVSCHSGFLLTSAGYANNGLVHAEADSGRARISLDSADAGLFRIPSLRNVAITGPYMHDGRMNSLPDVIEHYDRGGEDARNQDDRIIPLKLSSSERSAIVAFLESLTDRKIHEGIQ